jgi:hypothetical protein
MKGDCHGYRFARDLVRFPSASKVSIYVQSLRGPHRNFFMAQVGQAQIKKPNIVFILADNVGYGVLSSYNGGILDTPGRWTLLACELPS